MSQGVNKGFLLDSLAEGQMLFVLAGGYGGSGGGGGSSYGGAFGGGRGGWWRWWTRRRRRVLQVWPNRCFTNIFHLPLAIHPIMGQPSPVSDV